MAKSSPGKRPTPHDGKKNDKPFDVWLQLGAAAVAIALYLLPKTPAVIFGLLLLMFILLVHPLWNLPWVERSYPRRIAALLVLFVVLMLVGRASWPIQEPGSRVRIVKIAIVPLDQQPPDQTQAPFPYVNFFFRNVGTKPAIGITHYVKSVFSAKPLSNTEVLDLQKQSYKEFDYKAEVSKQGNVMYPYDEERFFSMPNSVRRTVMGEQFAKYFPIIRPGSPMHAYFLVTTKFRDEGSSAGAMLVSELCAFYIGNLETRHNCGNARTFLEGTAEGY